LVEPLGDMLDQAWEEFAIALANASETEIGSVIDDIVKKCKIDLNNPATVVVGRDTRPSGEKLVLAIKDGIEVMGGIFQDFGVVTTPQLHYITRCLNTKDTPSSYGEATLDGYYQKLAEAFKRIVVCAHTLKQI
jgi:phosphoacetylglucosamine mutase